MTLEKQINKITKKMFQGNKDIIISKRGPYVYIPPTTLNFTPDQAEKYLHSFKGISTFLNDCHTEFMIYLRAPSPQKWDTDFEGAWDDRGKACRILENHKFWKKENSYSLILSYLDLMASAIRLRKKDGSRNSLALNKETCISYFQEINGVLVVVSRSCDFSLGFLADMYLISEIAKMNNCNSISWTHANLHTYKNNFFKTSEQYEKKIKCNNFTFNIR